MMLGLLASFSMNSRPLLTSLGRVAAAVVLAAALSGCSLWNKDDIIPDEPAEKLYNEGVYLMNQRQDWKAAAKKFEEVERQHPYSDWARKALIMTAYAH